jgi:hypothetical protein
VHILELCDIIALMSIVTPGGNFEALQIDLARQGVTPIDLPVPDDNFDWRRQQFNVLRGLGYPVELSELPVEYAREAYAGYVDPETQQQGISEVLRPIYEERFHTYRDWRLPVVRHPGFADWIRPGVGVNIEGMDLSAVQRTDLNWHPATVLPGAVDLGLFKTIREYKDKIHDSSPYMSDGEQWRAHRRFVGACYISAFDRYMAMAQLAPRLLKVEELQASRADVALQRSYSNGGLEGVHPYELVALMRDFYIMLGAAVPQFAEFRTET